VEYKTRVQGAKLGAVQKKQAADAVLYEKDEGS
jgi:hypothetical protein